MLCGQVYYVENFLTLIYRFILEALLGNYSLSPYLLTYLLTFKFSNRLADVLGYEFGYRIVIVFAVSRPPPL